MWNETLQNLMEHWAVKLMAAIAAALFGPWRMGYTALAILMVLDLVLGSLVAIREGRFSPVVARKKSVAKLLVYWGLIIAAYQVEVMLSAKPLTADLGAYSVDVTVAYLGLTEFSSILRHIQYLSGGRINPLHLGRRIQELKDGSVANTGKSGQD